MTAGVRGSSVCTLGVSVRRGVGFPAIDVCATFSSDAIPAGTSARRIVIAIDMLAASVGDCWSAPGGGGWFGANDAITVGGGGTGSGLGMSVRRPDQAVLNGSRGRSGRRNRVRSGLDQKIADRAVEGQGCEDVRADRDDRMRGGDDADRGLGLGKRRQPFAQRVGSRRVLGERRDLVVDALSRRLR